MKLTNAMVVAGMMILFAGTALGEVVIKKAPLRWDQVATLDGEVVFNNLCASCHGISAKGDGPAVMALELSVPDLTVLAANNGGVYPHHHVQHVINGRFREDPHRTVGMPKWGEQFEYIRRGGPSRAYAWERVDALNKHIASLQAN
jgi:mono/diheme cytochrome c family protein